MEDQGRDSGIGDRRLMLARRASADFATWFGGGAGGERGQGGVKQWAGNLRWREAAF